ncbi:hypothetical protein Neosp_003287 [[Neocosmospora] mangrovei]
MSNTQQQASGGSKKDFSRDSLFDLSGKVALVTGGGSGIGLMATQALAVNGAKVYITGRTKEKLDRVTEQYGKNISGEIIPIVGDINTKQGVQKLFDEYSSRENCLCILVNNAGVSSKSMQVEAETAQEMRQNIFDNKDSTGMIQKAQHHFAYNASKGAAEHLTRMLASEIAGNKLKIRVNGIAPGVFPSEMTTEGSDEAQKSKIPREKYEAKVPAGRPGKDEDMAQAVLFFATNQYLVGQTLAVDGGYTIAAGM